MHGTGVVARLTAAIEEADLGQVALLVERHWSDLLGHDIALLRRAIGMVPSQQLPAHPAVVLAAEAVEALRPGVRAVGDPAVEQILQSFDRYDDAQLQASAGLAAAIALRNRGRCLEAVDLGERVLAVAETADDRGADGRVEPASVLLHLGLAALLAGDQIRAQRYLTAAYRRPSSVPSHALDAAGKLAVLFALEGESHLAEYWLDRAEAIRPEVDDWWMTSQQLLCPGAARMLLAVDRLDWQAYHRTNRTIHALAANENWAFVLYARARAALFLGNQRGIIAQLHDYRSQIPDQFSPESLATHLLDTAEAELWLSVDERDRAAAVIERLGDHPIEKVTAARWHLLQRQPEAAEPIVDQTTWPAITSRRDRLTLLLMALTAQVRRRAHREERARLIRQISIETAYEIEPWLFSFATTDRDVVDLIMEHASELSGLREALDRHDITTPLVTRPPEVRLTRRERLVLEHLADAKPIGTIAEELQVSPATIRNQRKSLYRKLGASSRDHAVEIAQRFGLIKTRQHPGP